MPVPVLSRRFLAVTLATVVVAVGTFSLGQWQLRRAAEKEGLQAMIAAQNLQSSLDGIALSQITGFKPHLYRPVVLRGQWQAQHTVYLDNRPMGDRTGFWVYTPLALEGSQKVVVVQRGWVPRNFRDRKQLPDIATPSGVVSVSGRIAPAPSKLFAFEGTDTGSIRQNIDLAAFRDETRLPLLDVSVLQIGPASEGLRREWPLLNLGVDKHYGYAFQWFGLCALVLGLYAWYQWFIPWRSRHKSLAA